MPMTVDNQELVLGIARDITDRKEMERRIMHAIMETEEKERQRFAQDLHDGLGPLLSTAKLYIRSQDTLQDPEKRAFASAKSMEIIDEAINSLRELANNISPHILKNFGLESALRSFVKQMNGTGRIEITLDSDLESRPEEQVEVALFRVVVEMLHNSLKHSDADRIHISMAQVEEELLVQYSDDGKGMDLRKVMANGSGHGMRNIESRISSINGKVNFITAPSEGFSARIAVNAKTS
jgi:signal transduction histidine kinase